MTRFSCQWLLARMKGSVCISKSQRISRFSFPETDSDLCIYYFLLDQNLVSCTISRESSFPPNHTYFCNSLISVRRIRLLCNQLFSFCHHMIYSAFLMSIIKFCFDLINSYSIFVRFSFSFQVSSA